SRASTRRGPARRAPSGRREGRRSMRSSWPLPCLETGELSVARAARPHDVAGYGDGDPKMTALSPSRPHPVDELLESLVGQPGSRQRLPTPILLADLDRLEANIARMAGRARDAGLAVRPHAKSHKCAAIARRQLQAGAVGICCAKVGEAEALAAAGTGPILLTSPIVGSDQARRVAALGRAQPGLAVVLDHPEQARELARACAGAATPLSVLIDVDVGLARTGVASPADALALAGAIGE